MTSLYSLFVGITLLGVVGAQGVDNKRLIRQEEVGSKQAFVGPGGVLVETKRHSQEADSEIECCCNEAYLFGDEKTVGGCGTVANAHAIGLNDTMCRDAARKMKLTEGTTKTSASPAHPYNIDEVTYGDVYPFGCFKKDSDDALWMNRIGDSPQGPIQAASRPVCHRPKYKKGTDDTNDGGCTGSDGYIRILTEEECREFADCSTHGVSEEFRIGIPAVKPGTDERPNEAHIFNNRPKGCFIDPTDDNVYFNMVNSSDVSTTTNVPSSPKGTPMCKIAAHGGNADGSAHAINGTATTVAHT